MFEVLGFGCADKSRSNPFLEPTSTTQWSWSFLLKVTMGAFDGVSLFLAKNHTFKVDNQLP